MYRLQIENMMLLYLKNSTSWQEIKTYHKSGITYHKLVLDLKVWMVCYKQSISLEVNCCRCN